MSLLDIAQEIKNNQKTITVFNPPPDSTIVSDVEEYFATQNVRVTAEQTLSREQAGIAELHIDETVLSTVSLSQLRELVSGGALSGQLIGVNDSHYREFLQHIKETTFVSTDTRRMQTVYSEIMDRARRVSDGTLYVSLNRRVAGVDLQASYQQLIAQQCPVHTFSAQQPPYQGETVIHHLEDTEEINRSWFAVFDAGHKSNYKTALLAIERGPGQFYGFWTDDPGIVDRIVRHLHSSYIDQSGAPQL